MTYMLAALVHLGEERLQLRDLLVAVPQLQLLFRKGHSGQLAVASPFHSAWGNQTIVVPMYAHTITHTTHPLRDPPTSVRAASSRASASLCPSFSRTASLSPA